MLAQVTEGQACCQTALDRSFCDTGAVNSLYTCVLQKGVYDAVTSSMQSPVQIAN